MKIKAFTIVELLIVLILTSIVFSSGYFLLNIVGDKFIKSRTEWDYDNEFLYFISVLENDLDQAKVINFKDLNAIAINNNFINYIFLPDKIIRYNELTSDTFLIPTSNLELSFMKKPVTHKYQLIDFISFNFLKNDFIVPFTYEKWYGAYTLIEYQ